MTHLLRRQIRSATRPFLVGVHGPAVGTGIARSIRANASSPSTPESWVHFCLTAADEAHASVLESPPLDPASERPDSAEVALRKLSGRRSRRKPPRLSGAELREAADSAAATAFRCCMPKLTCRRNVQAYIACVGAGTARRYITGAEARSLLYTAQLAISAYPKRTRTPRVERKKVGFA